SICAALLHDVVEDTDYTVEDIEGIFGKRIATIVDGLTKIAGGVFGDKASSQAENFRKLLLTISEDVRVIMIKIADRLHNMRTLSSMPPNKQYKIAGETLYIYAPLAHRLGLFRIKTELEDLSFHYEHPEKFEEINALLEAGNTQREEVYAHFITPLCEKLDALGYTYSVQNRQKTVYSIYHKMETKHVPFNEIYDLMAVRIIYQVKEGMDEKAQAWMIYSAITSLYRPHPDRIRDWISTPKSNGYEALHVTVMGPDGQWIEVQIRSERMHEIAERGISAHWKYKQDVEGPDSELDEWLKTIKDILNNPEPSALDFLDTFKLNLFTNEIFVFTPTGEIKTLPQGATALDFAFMLHSDLGSQCIGAKVNRRLVPLSEQLKSGDQVEVLTSTKQTPQREWLNFCTTATAKNKLKSYFRKEDRKVMESGKQALEELFRRRNLTLDNQAIQLILNYFNIQIRNNLYYEIGKGVIRLEHLLEDVFQKKKEEKKGFLKYVSKVTSMIPSIPLLTMRKEKEEDEGNKQADIAARARKDAQAVANATANSKTNTDPEKFDPSVAGFETTPSHDAALPKINKKKVLRLSDDAKRSSTPYGIAPCCHPIPGDDVIAFINEDYRSVTLHQRNCGVADKLKANFGERIVQAVWTSQNQTRYPVRLAVNGIDTDGIAGRVLGVLYEKGVKVTKVRFEEKDGIFKGEVEIQAHSAGEVQEVRSAMELIKEVSGVTRTDGNSEKV
ncbi:MAG: bifunctional (p)ppGpp synthetase/guanosine-3',5'-bis(diphosphate) 3'-pyrophosphohydrolase, partial [Paludibacteraceae bacterium]|nr:bifunctional (p)ppGpp synthetase/guanosine-3',5'-bis(diphosphate) 3'-pyrophosphohydrolase [Paludibacteraceae bacterium]